MATCNHYFVKIEPSERAFATRAQRSLSDGRSPLGAALQDGGLLLLQSLCGLHFCLHVYSRGCASLTGDSVSASRTSDPVAAEESSLADGLCSLSLLAVH